MLGAIAGDVIGSVHEMACRLIIGQRGVSAGTTSTAKIAT